MAKEPDRRYDSAGALADDLRRYLEHRPVKARRIGLLGRSLLWYRRNRVLATSLIGAVLLVAVVSASSYWGVVRERDRYLKQREMARESLYYSLVGEARAVRLGRQNGYRKQVWSLLRRAKDISTPANNATVLRHEAVQCMGDFVALEPTIWPQFRDNEYGLAIARHPNSEWVAIGTPNGSVTVRRIADGQEVSRVLHAAPHELRDGQCHMFGIAFSPSGQVLATADSHGFVKCWHPEADRWVLDHTFQMDVPANPRQVSAVSVFVTSDDRFVLGASRGSTGIRMWDVTSGEQVASFQGQLGERFVEAALSPDDRTLVGVYLTNNFDGIVVWDLVRREWKRRIPLTPNALLEVSFSPDGRYLGCATNEGAMVLESASFERVLASRGDFLLSLCFSPDGHTLALPSRLSRTIRLLDLDTFKETAVLPLDDDPLAAFFSEDGKHLVGLSATQVLSWSLEGAGDRVLLPGHTATVNRVAFSPDGRVLASTGQDQVVRLADAASGKPLTVISGFRGPTSCLAFSQDGKLLTVADGSKMLKVYNVEQPEHPRLTAELPHELGSFLWNIVVDGEEKLLAASGHRGVRLWRLQRNDVDGDISLSKIAHPAETLSSSLALNAVGDRLAWVDSESQLHVWDIERSQEIAMPYITATVTSGLAFLPDNRRLVFINGIGHIEIRNVNSPETPVAEFGDLPSELSDVTISGSVDLTADGRWLVAQGPALTVWDIESQELVVALPKGQGTVTAGWNFDRTRLAVGSSVGEVTIWQFPTIRNELTQLGLSW